MEVFIEAGGVVPNGSDRPDWPAIAFYNLGCRANQYETDQMVTQAEALGCRIVNWDEPADAYVVNSCTVTSTADHKSRQAVRKAIFRNPNAKVILTGCYAMLKPKIFQEFPNTLLFLDNREKEKFGALVAAHVMGEGTGAQRGVRQRNVATTRDSSALAKRPKRRRVRANLMIQNGCDHFCTFCVIPFTRGRSRSTPIDHVVRQAEALIADGAREIVLSGINLGSYGRDLGITLSDAIRAIAAVPGLLRLRLSSLEPQHVDDALLETIVTTPNVCPYIYAPLQSGDDGVLAAMKRGYTSARYREIIERIRRTLPHASINTDVIVGFPGESDEAFENTYRFCDEIGFTRMHIFPYSKRPHTPAARMNDQLHGGKTRDRAARLQALRGRLMGAFHQKWIGETADVLVEFVNPETGLHEGLTPEYIRVFFESDQNLMGETVPVTITEARDDDVIGRICE